MKWPFRRRETTPAPLTAARVEPVVVRRSFRAAYPDRLAAGFSIFPTSVRDETRREIRGLIQHSRHAAHNFDFARNYEMLFRRHVIGPNGIRLQMDVRDAPDRRDTVANAAIEAAWVKWGKRGNATICGRLSWWGVECAVATGLAREGGAFVRLHKGRSRGPFGFQVEPLPFDLLDLDLTTPLSDGGWIESGIEFNADGRVMAYYLWNMHPAESHRPGARQRIRIPADQMVHVLVPEEIGQVLGIPRSATALRLMNMAEKYQESAMAAANYGAAQMVFFTQTDDSGQIGAAADAEVPIDEIEAGTMATLPPGVTPVPHTPHYPDAAIEPFMRHMNTTISAGLGVAAETLTSDLSRATFSSLRAGKGEERDEWRMLQRAVYEGLHDQVFARWLPNAILFSQIRLPMAKVDKFLAPVWRPRGWASVNPKDDASAAQTEIALGLRSRTEIAAERGRDFADICAERAAENDLMRSFSLNPDDASSPAAPEPPPSPEEMNQ